VTDGRLGAIKLLRPSAPPPWLFTINRQGVIAARLQGAFGVNEARQAIQAALRH
jgi:hypothetical protein